MSYLFSFFDRTESHRQDKRRNRSMTFSRGPWSAEHNGHCSFVVCAGYREPRGEIYKLITSTKAKTMAVSQALICCWVWLSFAARASQCSCSNKATQTQTPNISHPSCYRRHYTVMTLHSVWCTTIGFLLQLLGESRLADVVHEFEQILPAFPPEAGLNVTQEGQVLLPRVGLGEQVLEGLPQREQDLLVVHWLVPTSDRKVSNFPKFCFFSVSSLFVWMWCHLVQFCTICLGDSS